MLVPYYVELILFYGKWNFGLIWCLAKGIPVYLTNHFCKGKGYNQDYMVGACYNDSYSILKSFDFPTPFLLVLPITTGFFISNIRLKLAENQAKAKQHSEAEILLFENYSLPSSTLPPKNKRRYCKKSRKNKYVCLND